MDCVARKVKWVAVWRARDDNVLLVVTALFFQNDAHLSPPSAEFTRVATLAGVPIVVR